MEKRENIREESEVSMRRGTSPETYTQEKVEGPATWEEERLMRQEPLGVREITWRPPTAGILEILAGAGNILAGIGAILGGAVLVNLFGSAVAGFFGTVAGAGLGGLLIALGIVSVIGGAFALRRRMWNWSLAGAITALFPTPGLLLGILSLIFVTISKHEFRE